MKLERTRERPTAFVSVCYVQGAKSELYGDIWRWVGYLCLRFTCEDEKHTVSNLTDIYSEYIDGDEGEFWGDGGGMDVSYVVNAGTGDCCTNDDGCDVKEKGERS
jgi:hypothetical protein